MRAARRDGPTACRWLRAKSGYGRPLDTVDWRTGDSPIETYWCLCTMEPTGPDDQVAHAHACREGRACFAPLVG